MSDEHKTESTEVGSTETASAEAPATEGVEDVEDEEKDEEDEENDEDEDDDDDHDEKGEKKKDKKKDKDKKLEIEFEATLPRTEAVSYFEAIVAGLRAGRVEFRQDGDTLVFNVPERVELEVEASLKGDKGKIVFEIEWSKKTRAVEISS